MSLHPVVSNSASVPTLDVLGTAHRILLDGRQTNGALAMVEVIGQPGDHLPLHVHHREEETFHLLEGGMEIICGGHKHELRAGDTFFAPRNIPHSPRFTGSGPGRVLVTFVPAGFERFFREAAELADRGAVTPGMLGVLLAEKYGCEMPPSSP